MTTLPEACPKLRWPAVSLPAVHQVAQVFQVFGHVQRVVARCPRLSMVNDDDDNDQLAHHGHANH